MHHPKSSAFSLPGTRQACLTLAAAVPADTDRRGFETPDAHVSTTRAVALEHHTHQQA